MASIHETHAGVARVTPHGQLRPCLHPKADDSAETLSRRTTADGPGIGPVRSITRGEAEGSMSPGLGPPPNGQAESRGRVQEHDAAGKLIRRERREVDMPQIRLTMETRARLHALAADCPRAGRTPGKIIRLLSLGRPENLVRILARPAAEVPAHAKRPIGGDA